MKTIRVGRYRPPGYPTKLEILARPDLLQKRVPQAWQRTPEMAGALAIFMAANAPGFKNEAKAGDSSTAGAWVAPIFEHGSGRGATGCMVMSPPVFLSEEEALHVIREELAKHEVELIDADRPMQGIKIPKIQLEALDREDAEPLLADASDPVKSVAIEFVSKQDHRDAESIRGLKEGSMVFSSVRSYDFKGVSEWVVEEVEKRGEEQIRFGTFYDPCVPLEVRETQSRSEEIRNASKDERRSLYRKHYQEARDAAEAESKRLLRQQVLDFVNWLKGQGVI